MYPSGPLPPHSNRRPVTLYFLLAFLFVFAAARQLRYFVDLAEDLELHYPYAWFSLGSPWPTVNWTDPSAGTGGLRNGDRVLSINGRALRGYKDLAGLTRQLGVNGTLNVLVSRDGHVQSIPVKIRPTRSRMKPLIWMVASVVWIALPLLCLALGFGVAAMKPRDPLAWLLLGILLGMSQMISAENVITASWEDWIRVPAILFRNLADRTWPIWMMLFGLYFPHRLRSEQRIWWAKWLLLAPIGLMAVAQSAWQAGLVENYPATEAWGWWVASTIRPVRLVSMVAVSFFFYALFQKAYSPSLDSDSRRRLHLLIYGSLVSLTPMFLLIATSLIRGVAIEDNILAVIAMLLMFLFPVTLAYLVVVHRALDVHVVVRQGLQYALASKSVGILRMGLTIVVAIFTMRIVENHATHALERLTVVIAGIAAILWMGRAADRLRQWIDRRFFRDAYRAEQILSELLTEVPRTVETRPLLETVAQRIADSLHVARITILVRDGNNCFAPAYALGGQTPSVGFTTTDPIIRRLEATREPWNAPPDDDRLHALDANLLLPLPARDRLLGFISLGPKRSEAPYSGSDVKLLHSVALQTGLALENSRLTEQIASEVARRERLSRELEIAREVQLRLLPQKQPDIPGLDYAAACRPAFEVGGDYYDFLAFPDNQFGFAIGDVSGKGVPAAMLMAALQAGLRGQTVDGVSDLSRLMTNLNRFLYDSTPRSHFATFFYAQYNPATREMRFCNAGHNPPLLLRHREVIRLVNCGPGLGLARLSRYRSESITLEPHDRLVLFTDGLPEAMNPSREEWGEEGLIAALGDDHSGKPSAILEHVLASAESFADGAPQHDDMTLVIIQVNS